MAKLIVQLDPVATLREAGKSAVPDPAAAAILAELGGADGIAVHLREDRRSIQDRDLRVLRKVVHTRFVFKMAPTSEMLGVALNIKPDIVILLPEMREENSPSGWARSDGARIKCGRNDRQPCQQRDSGRYIH